jgi:hypothetical protein
MNQANHTHSNIYPFQVESHGVLYDCSFVLTDDRLITVTAVGKKRTEGLGATPPRALAIALAMELIRETEPSLPTHRAEAEVAGKSWWNGLLERFGVAEPICVH